MWVFDMNILLIEDNIDIIDSLKYAFLQTSYNFNYVTTIKDTIKYINDHTIHLIILDITLPDGDGFLLFSNYIKKSKIPTIFLTANDSEDDIVKGLSMGAEDYMVKPFSIRELIARIDRILRHRKNIITLKDLKFDIDKMTVYKGNEQVQLTGLEMRIIILLLTYQNKIVTRDMILDCIYEATGNDVDSHTITVYIKRIRKKLDTDIIKTIKGIGYRIDTNEE